MYKESPHINFPLTHRAACCVPRPSLRQAAAHRARPVARRNLADPVAVAREQSCLAYTRAGQRVARALVSRPPARFPVASPRSWSAPPPRTRGGREGRRPAASRASHLPPILAA